MGSEYGLALPDEVGIWDSNGNVKEGRSKTWAVKEVVWEASDIIERREELVRTAADGAVSV